MGNEKRLKEKDWRKEIEKGKDWKERDWKGGDWKENIEKGGDWNERGWLKEIERKEIEKGLSTSQ